jgi:hypothetical protein
MDRLTKILEARKALARAERAGYDLAACRHRDWLSILADTGLVHNPTRKDPSK